MKQKTQTQTQTPKVVKVQKLADFLALLPSLMGFTVNNSIVITLFKANRVFSAIRCDLPALGADLVNTKIDKTIIGLVKRSTWVTAVSIVIYTDEKFADAQRAPRILLSTWLEYRLGLAGINVIENVCIAGDRWSSYRDTKSITRGLSLTDISSSAIAQVVKEEINEPISKLADLGVASKPDRSLKTDIAIKIAELQKRAGHTNNPNLDIKTAICLFEDFFDRDSNTKSVDKCAEFVLALQDNRLWMVATLVLAMNSDPEMQFLYSLEHNNLNFCFSAQSLKQTLHQLSQHRISPAELRNRCNSLTELAAVVPDENLAPLSALLAWAWWEGGMSTPAFLNLERALKHAPKETVTQAVELLLDSGPPLWIFEEERATAS